MTQTQLRLYRNIPFIVMIALLPVTGFVWGSPSGTFTLAVSSGLSIASVASIFFVSLSSAMRDAEISRLAGELDKSSTQIIELVEAERQDDRIIDSLTVRTNRLKSDLIMAQTKFGFEPTSIENHEKASSGLPENTEQIESNMTEERPQLYSAQEFGLLAREFARVASRYQRAFSVTKIDLNIDDRRREVGAEQAVNEFKAASQTILGTLRSTDFATSDGSHSMTIGYPETSATHVGGILNHLRASLKSSDAKFLKIDLDSAEGDDIPHLLSES